jgi:PAS domain S-box-containing protein
LRETKDYLESLIGYANAPIIVWDPSFKITRFNRAFERLTGRKAEEVLGRSLEMLFPLESRDESLTYIWRTLSGERWESLRDTHTPGRWVSDGQCSGTQRACTRRTAPG